MTTGWVYGTALAVSLVCMGLVDYRWRLVAARDWATTAGVIGLGVAGLLAWDLLGISTGIFFRGAGPWLTGWHLAPELPVEELLFLALLVHVALVARAAAERVLAAGGRAAVLLRRGARAAWAVLPLVLVASTALGSGVRGTRASLAYAGIIGVVLVPLAVLVLRRGRGDRADALSAQGEGGAMPVGRRPGGDGVTASGRRQDGATAPGARSPGAEGLTWAGGWTALASVCVLTAVFDSLLVGLGIVGYDWPRTSGLRIGLAPLEDFGYTVAACLAAPALWERWHRAHTDSRQTAARRRDRGPEPGSQHGEPRNSDQSRERARRRREVRS